MDRHMIKHALQAHKEKRALISLYKRTDDFEELLRAIEDAGNRGFPEVEAYMYDFLTELWMCAVNHERPRRKYSKYF